MLRPVQTRRGDDAVDAATVDALSALFEAVTGVPPRRLRAFRADDALLLLVRYEDAATDPPVEIALMALPELVAEAVAKRTGHILVSGGVSLCAAKNLAVLAFSLLEEAAGDAGLRLAG